MSTENVRAFLNKARSDKQLQAKFKNLPSDSNAAVKKIVQIGKDAGYHFTEQDWLRLRKESLQKGEISQADLDKISGGTLMTLETAVLTGGLMLTVTVCVGR